MNKFFLSLPLVIISIFGFSGCATMGNNTVYTLDDAIKSTASSFNRNLLRGSKLTMLNFSSSSTGLSQYVIDQLSSTISSSTTLVVTDRKELDLIRAKSNLKITDVVDDNYIASIGRILGVEYVLTGSFTDAGTFYWFRVSAVRAMNATRIASVSLKVDKSDAQIGNLLSTPAADTATDTGTSDTGTSNTGAADSGTADTGAAANPNT